MAADGAVGFGAEVLGLQKFDEVAVADIAVALRDHRIGLLAGVVGDSDECLHDGFVGFEESFIGGDDLLILHDDLTGLRAVEDCLEVKCGEGRAFEAVLSGGVGESAREFGVALFGGEVGERDHRRRVAGVVRED